MNENEATEDRKADRTGCLPPEGGVTNGSGRPGATGRPHIRFRLKRSIDCFSDDRRDIRLIHDGLREEYIIDQPGTRDLLVLELLRDGFVSQKEIEARLLDEGHGSETLAGSLAELERIGVLEREPASRLLSASEAERFDRQLIYLADIAPQGTCASELQQRLRRSRVAILGCGGLGSWAATGLALAGVGHLTLIDDDAVELSNLNRQLLFRTEDLGRNKVEVAAESLAALDPALEITPVQRRLDSIPALTEAAAGNDLLVMTADHPPYELARMVDHACLEAGIPWISAGQIPPMIRIGPTIIPGITPCHACQEESIRRDYPLYDRLARHRAETRIDAATLGAASGTIGSLIAMEAIHHLTGTLEPATLGKVMLMDLRTLRVTFDRVEANPECECRGRLRPA